MTRTHDVLVVGGGAAGLSAALTLARARRSVLVVDAGQPRNGVAAGVHSFLSHEGIAPADLVAAGRAEIASYGAEVLLGTATAVRRADGGFELTVDGASVLGRRLLVTTGLVDELPDVPGLRDRWGREVLHCPYCHGWEVRDQQIGVLATGPASVHQALMFRQWSKDVVLFLHTFRQLTDEQSEQLEARGIPVVAGEVTQVMTYGDRLTGLRLSDGRVVDRQVVVVGPRFEARSELLLSLGIEPSDQLFEGHSIGSYVLADSDGRTEVPGVWVAGNVADVSDQVMAAAASGVKAAAGINADMVDEEVAAAVMYLRSGSGLRTP